MAVLLAVFVATFSTSALDMGRAAAKDDGAIPGKYIVVLRDGVQDVEGESSRLSGKHRASRGHVYRAALKGFAAEMSPQQAAALAAERDVEYVVPDRLVQISPIVQAKGKNPPPPSTGQSVPVGILRIGVSATTLNKGTGVGVAVIDTGIELTHPDLSANIKGNVTFVPDTSSGNDDNGHGTHVAGTIAALDNTAGVRGVAPEVDLYAVKVLDRFGSGSWSSVIQGVDWVTANAATLNIRVVNMSLGGTGTSDDNCGNTNNDPLHRAICNSVAAGVTYVVAAGNSAANAAGQVPASYDDAVITVSAMVDTDGQPGGKGQRTPSGRDDSFANFSNFGAVVDIAAPGVNVQSTWVGGRYNTISGTSMAAPHVSGAAALYVRTQLLAGVTPTPTQVRQALSTAGWQFGDRSYFTGDPDAAHEPLLQASGL